MNVREALIAQAPNLELFRAAQSEIARQDAALREARALLRECCDALARAPVEQFPDALRVYLRLRDYLE